MNTMKSWRIALVMFSLLLICALVWPVPSLAAARFTCKASALRIDQLLGQILEPVVANPPEDPCKTDNKVFLGFHFPNSQSPDISAEVLVAATEDSKAPVTAEGFAAGVDILGLVSAEVLDATARVKSVSGKCVLSSESSVTSAVVQGQPIELIDDHLDIPIPLVGTLHFNETLAGTNKVTQRALWLQITNPLLQQTTGVEEVVVGEAIADFEGGNPCAKKPPVVDKRRMTGGGKFDNVTHGFVLHCNASRLPNNLQVNWNGNKFHLESLTSATCSNDPGIDPGQPAAGFDTYKGKGTGRYNGVSGATAEWTFTDAGEPGKGKDSAKILIKDKDGNVKLNAEGVLNGGNHQAHGN